MRLFVALELPPEARAALAQWTRSVLGDADVRLLAPGSLHVTLCFLGEVADARAAAAIGSAVTAAVSGSRAMPLSVSDLVRLPARRPRVLAVTVDGPGLGALQARVASALVAGGWYAAEARPYLGHVTVARARAAASRVAPSAPLRSPSALGAPALTFTPALTLGAPALTFTPALTLGAPALTFTADTVAVMRSHLGSGPARYEALARVGLAGTAE